MSADHDSRQEAAWDIDLAERALLLLRDEEAREHIRSAVRTAPDLRADEGLQRRLLPIRALLALRGGAS